MKYTLLMCALACAVLTSPASGLRYIDPCYMCEINHTDCLNAAEAARSHCYSDANSAKIQCYNWAPQECVTAYDVAYQSCVFVNNCYWIADYEEQERCIWNCEGEAQAARDACLMNAQVACDQQEANAQGQCNYAHSQQVDQCEVKYVNCLATCT